ncbi:hypothetical protein ACFL3Q_03480 [Planctomycetota bacterium]
MILYTDDLFGVYEILDGAYREVHDEKWSKYHDMFAQAMIELYAPR